MIVAEWADFCDDIFPGQNLLRRYVQRVLSNKPRAIRYAAMQEMQSLLQVSEKVVVLNPYYFGFQITVSTDMLPIMIEWTKRLLDGDSDV